MEAKHQLIFIIGILFVLMLFFLLGRDVYVGMTTELTSNLCETAEECAEGTTCCYFAGEQSGVCAEADQCENIKELTEDRAVLNKEQAKNIDTYLYYIPLIILSLMFAVIVYIYFH